jgi:hypothetical protein
VNRFYEGADSLFVRAYDAFYVGGAPIPGDVAFYVGLGALDIVGDCNPSGVAVMLVAATGQQR